MKIGSREIKRVGLGTNRLTNSAENRAFLKDAVAAGLDHIDTAHLYSGGESERTIGEALAPFPEHVVVATKGGYHGGGLDRLRMEIDQSLESLRTDSIALFYLHRIDPTTPLEDSLGLLAELRNAGKVQNVGISDVSIGEIDRARRVVEIAAVQNEFNLGERSDDEVIDFCAVEGIAFVPFFPLRGNSRAVDEIASAHGASANQVKIAWLLKRSRVMAPIPGTLSLPHLLENLAALDIELSEAEFERLGG
jgi:pyridoxine 4-dehydrogenase